MDPQALTNGMVMRHRMHGHLMKVLRSEQRLGGLMWLVRNSDGGKHWWHPAELLGAARPFWLQKGFRPEATNWEVAAMMVDYDVPGGLLVIVKPDEPDTDRIELTPQQVEAFSREIETYAWTRREALITE